MKQLPGAALLFVFVAVTSHAFADAGRSSRFVFKVPDGWTDKSSPDTRSFFTFAVNSEEHLVFQAKVAEGATPVSNELLEHYASDAQKSVQARVPGARFKVLDKELVKLHDTLAMRFVFELVPPGGDDVMPVRQLQFYVPVVDQHAVLTFSAPPGSFEKFLPLFDRTALAMVVKK